MGMAKKAVTLTLDPKLRAKLEAVAAKESRSLSSLIELALKDWLQLREELHPRFVADIKEALADVERGEVVPYERVSNIFWPTSPITKPKL